MDASVTGRLKELYALWQELHVKKQYRGKLDMLSDVVALRVVLDIPQRPGEPPDEWKTRGVWLCYHVLGLVQHLPDCQVQCGVGCGLGSEAHAHAIRCKAEHSLDQRTA